MMRNIIIILLIALLAQSCAEDDAMPDYTVAGRDVTVRMRVDLPVMESKTRADLSDNQINHVESLWVRTYSSVSGDATSEWLKLAPDTRDTEQLRDIELETKSGPSYIVGVANVDNPGALRSAPKETRPLSELLDEANTWKDFLDIAVLSPSTFGEIDAPGTPLPMCGAFTNKVTAGHGSLPERVDDWETENFMSYTIPSSDTGPVAMTDGAIHLRRLVSQVRFRVTQGKDITLTPTAYQVVNAPRYSWLYERDRSQSFPPNFGDVCTEQNSGDYYASTPQYAAANFSKEGDAYTFSFWQAENKHVGLESCVDYNDRQKQVLRDGANTGLFTSLTGESWSPDNMASYVKLSCMVEYNGQISVDGNGKPDSSGDKVYRSGMATFLIHLGYMGGDARDFNCYRNVRYTYDVTVNGIDDIRVEAFQEGATPGMEGLVSDVNNPSITLDCHYSVFNVQLTDTELMKWKENPDGTSEGFGFIILTYDNLNGGEKQYQEADFRDRTFDDLTDTEKMYVDWIELRPTTGPERLEPYKPRGTAGGGDGKTFNLLDASKGISDIQKSSSGYYTDTGKSRVETFWDGVDFGNHALSLDTAFMEQSFADFVALFPAYGDSTARRGVHAVINGAAADAEASAFLMRVAEKYLYDPNSPMLNEEYYRMFLEEWLRSDIPDDAARARMEYQLEQTAMNRVGQRAADFRFVERDGKESTLYAYGVPGADKLVIFYDPDCENCRSVVETLRADAGLAENVSAGRISVLCVCPDGDTPGWKERRGKIPDLWTDAYSPGGELAEGELYSLRATPTVYMLSADNKVLVKDMYVPVR